MAGAVRVFNGKFANVQGAEAVQRVLASIPAKLAAPVQAAVDAGGDELVEQAKAIAPVAPEFEPHPGQMRDGIRREANGRALSTTVVVDAEDAKGDQYPAHVEYGHTDARSGKHVPAKPFFWPAYRVTKKRIRSRVQRAVREGVKAAAGAGT